MHKQDLEFKNRNGKRILATVRTPVGDAKGTILLLHGLGGWKEQPLLVIIAEELCKHGYVVCAFDGADGAKGPDADFLNHTTTGYIEDLEDVVEYVTHADWFSGPLILAGHSMGGLASLHYTRTHPARVAKLIMIAPAVSWTSGIAFTFLGGLWWLARNKNKTPGPHRSKLPLDRKWLLDFMKFDARREAPYVSAPALIISASRDGSVVASPKAHYALGARFPNATTIVIPGAGHVFWKHELKVADTILKWLTSS